LPATAQLALTSCYQSDTQHSEVFINGGRMQLEPISRAIVRLLAGSVLLSLAEVFASLPQTPQQVIRAAVTELARYEVVTIIHEKNN